MTAGRVAVVTGAGTGIGLAAARALAGDGFAVVLAGRRPEPLAEAAEAIAGTGGTATPWPCDVSDPAKVEALFGHVVDRHGRIDILFNNAGRGAHGAIDTLAVAAWRAVVDLNLTGTFLCTQAAFRLMKAQSPQGGRIINNGSISAHSPRPLSAAYTATKHAITGLTKATALDGRPYRIACGQIDIGNAATDAVATLARGAMQPDGTVRPEPMMAVDEVAAAISFMAGLPLESNVQFMTVMATNMPFIGRG